MNRRGNGIWKKIILGGLALATSLALAACGGEDSVDDQNYDNEYSDGSTDNNNDIDIDSGNGNDGNGEIEDDLELLQRLVGFMELRHTEGALANQLAEPAPGEEFAIIHTNFGEIHMRLFHDLAPATVENFVTHAKNGFYDGLIFHRVMDNFMIQGGCPLGNGTGGDNIWGQPFNNELTVNLNHIRGAVSMANRGPFTNGSQFFIVQNPTLDAGSLSVAEFFIDNQDLDVEGADGYYVSDIWPAEFMQHYIDHGGAPWLDFAGGFTDNPSAHAIFGQVFYGMDVVDAISGVEVYSDNPGFTPPSIPVEDVIIERIEIATR